MPRKHYKNWVVDSNGNALAAVAVEIRDQATLGLIPAAELYTAATGTDAHATNPFACESDGSFSIWLDPGVYTVTLGIGASSGVYDIYIEDLDIADRVAALESDPGVTAGTVQAAGALMDSELTSEASVKAINQGLATTDTPTFVSVTTPVIRRSNATGTLAMRGGTSVSDGANLEVYGSAHASFPNLAILEGDDVRIRTVANANMATFTADEVVITPKTRFQDNIVVGTTFDWDVAGSWRGIKLTDRHALQATHAASSIVLSSNAAVGAVSWEYTVSGVAAGNYTISGDTHSWNHAGLGTDGGAVSFTEIMQLSPTNLDVAVDIVSDGTIGGTKHFLTRALANAWLASATPSVGERISIYDSNCKNSLLVYHYTGVGSGFYSNVAYDGWEPAGLIRPEHFFAVGNGTTDDSAAMQNAIDYVSQRGGGSIVLSLGNEYRISSDLIISRGVTIKGEQEINVGQGMTTVAAVTFGTGIPVNTSTKTVDNGGTYYRPVATEIPFTTDVTFDSAQWVNIIANNGGATTYRVDLTHENNRSRLLVESTVSLYIMGSAALKSVHVHRYAYPYHNAADTGMAGTAIRIAEGGSKVSECYITGFNLGIEGLGGARGYLENIHIDCRNGIDFDGVYDRIYFRGIHCWPFMTVGNTGGADDLLRGGIAFNIQQADWAVLTDCFAYGYTTGFEITGNSISLTGCGADNFATGHAAGSVGFKISAAARSKMVNCNSGGHDNSGVRVNNTGNQMFQIANLSCWSTNGSETTNGIFLEAGKCTVVNSQFNEMISAFHLGNNTGELVIGDGNYVHGCTYFCTVNASADTSKLKISKNILTDFASGTSLVNVASGSFAITALTTSGSGATLNLPPDDLTFSVGGSGDVSALAGGWAGRIVSILFTGTVTFNHLFAGTTTNMRLLGSANFSGSSGRTLTLMHNGTQWFEISRAT